MKRMVCFHFNKVYQENLNNPAPFMTFAICGNQSAGKRSIMERFMGSVINIAQEGTGSTCCPLDTTCIHDDGCEEAQCDFIGTEFENGGTGGRKLSLKDIFERIVTTIEGFLMMIDLALHHSGSSFSPNMSKI